MEPSVKKLISFYTPQTRTVTRTDLLRPFLECAKDGDIDGVLEWLEIRNVNQSDKNEALQIVVKKRLKFLIPVNKYSFFSLCLYFKILIKHGANRDAITGLDPMTPHSSEKSKSSKSEKQAKIQLSLASDQVNAMVKHFDFQGNYGIARFSDTKQMFRTFDINTASFTGVLPMNRTMLHSQSTNEGGLYIHGKRAMASGDRGIMEWDLETNSVCGFYPAKGKKKIHRNFQEKFMWICYTGNIS